MSFLWRSADASSNLCKFCIDKEKRIQDYDIFFNETKDVLKTKEESLLESQVKIAEKISEIELLKKVYDSEKRQWLEDRKIWNEFRRKYHEESMEWEVEKSKYEEMLEDMSNDKIIWNRLQKTYEDKISNLVHSLKESDNKYQDLLQRVTEQNVLQSDELREREEDIISVYEKRIEEMIEEYDEKENEWSSKQSDYEIAISGLEEKNNDLAIKIQDLKYDQQCMIESHERQIRDQEEKWEKRITILNETYDIDFIQYKQHLKQKEEMIEKEKNEMIETLKFEIDVLKKENHLLEETKRSIEKKIAETNKENKSLKDKCNDEQKQNEILKIEKQMLQQELATNKKILEDTTMTSNTIEIHPLQGLNPIVKLDLDSDLGDDEKRKKKRMAKKRNAAPVAQATVTQGSVTQGSVTQGSLSPVFHGNNFYGAPYVEAMNKNECEKKTYTEKTESDEQYLKHCIIDIQEEHEELPANFFLPNTPVVFYDKILKLEQQVKQYEQEIEILKIQNSEYTNKIKSYECNSILQLNRNLRSGIPVRFLPYHTNLSPIYHSQTPTCMNHTID